MDFSLPHARTWPQRPLIMGIVNVTPNSFSDGGHHLRWEKGVELGLRLVAEGADILDIGGESTRPGAKPVTVQEELDRTSRVIEALSGEVQQPLSIDTRKPEVAEEALALGAVIINDVTGFTDSRMIELAVDQEAIACVMHMQGEPQSMQETPHYYNVLAEVRAFLADQAFVLKQRGLPHNRIWIDPGIGFGKSVDHNLDLIAGLDSLSTLGYPVVVGASRKRFIGEISGDPVGERLAGSLAAVEWAMKLPRRVVRAHDVAATRQYILVQRQLRIHRAARLRGSSG
jgi:dihydropteroate synthase